MKLLFKVYSLSSSHIIDDTYLGLDSSHNLCENLLSCERIHMFQQENFLLNLPQGCKAQFCHALLGYPFCNMAAHT